MGMKHSEPRRRPGRAVILRWAAELVVLGLLMVSLLSMPFQMYAVRTGSMEPTFAPRSLVLVHTGEFHQGQPISFTHNGEVITHRFKSVNADGSVVTKGDANTTADPWVVQPREIIGGVIASVPWLGYWFVYLKTMAGLASVICAVVGTVFLWSIVRELDDKPGADSDDRSGRNGAGQPVIEYANAAQFPLA
jgi:signal peptidase